MILLIDNYDSFTYNLVQYFQELKEEVAVFKNDALTLEEAKKMKFTHLVISPGPSNPDHAGISMDFIRYFAGKIPILGVCLGHQCIAQSFGGKISRAERLMHGKTSAVYHDGKGIYQGLPNPFAATRYHSLIVEEKSLPAEFLVTAQSEEKELMGIRHKNFPIEGVQFHPESILTACGKKLLENFLKL